MRVAVLLAALALLVAGVALGVALARDVNYRPNDPQNIRIVEECGSPYAGCGSDPYYGR